MNYVLITLSLALASIVQTTGVIKPKLLHLHDIATVAPMRHKLPEERRQLSVFPKSNMKFIVTPFVYRRYEVLSPHKVTKKPVMPKLVLKHKRPDIAKVGQVTKHSIINKVLNIRPTTLQPASIIDIKEDIEEFIKPAELNYASHNDTILNRDFNVQGDYSEDMATVIYPIEEDNNVVDEHTKNNDLNIEDFVFTPKVKPTEATIGGNTLRIPDLIFRSEINCTEATRNSLLPNEGVVEDDNTSPEEIADRNEYIFLNSNKTENFMPTTTNQQRAKRSVNVIEEENRASTVSGFKLTEKDTGLSNDLYFKNINT